MHSVENELWTEKPIFAVIFFELDASGPTFVTVSFSNRFAKFCLLFLAVLWHIVADSTVFIEVVTAGCDVDATVWGEDHHSGLTAAAGCLAAVARAWL